MKVRYSVERTAADQYEIIDRTSETVVASCPSFHNATMILTALTRNQAYFADVGDFHRKFGLPTADSGAPRFLPGHAERFRIKFMHEELAEFEKACEEADMPGALDALVDIIYVALGTAHLMGLPFDQAWAIVHDANMKKVRAASKDESKRRHALDVVKPPGWTPPDHSGILAWAGWTGE